MAIITLTIEQKARGVFIAEAVHGSRFLKDAKVIAAQLVENDNPAPEKLCELMGVPATTWAEIAAIVLAKEE
jgi:hypothetical protein